MVAARDVGTGRLSDYVTTMGFSHATGLSVESVRRRLKDGRIACVSTRLGRLIPRTEVERWLAEHPQDGATDAA